MVFPNLSSLLVLAQGRRRSLFVLYVLVLVSAAMESIGIASFYPLVDVLNDGGQIDHYKAKFASWLPAVGNMSREQFLPFILLTIGTLFVFKNALLILASYGNIRVCTNLYSSWMNQIFKIYMGKPYTFFLENKAGDLVQRKIIQTQQALGALRVFIMLLGNITTILGVFLVLCVISPEIILLVIFLLLPVYFITMKISQSIIYTAADRIVELQKQGFSVTTEVLSGIKQVKVFCAENHFQKTIKNIWEEFSKHYIKNQFLGTLPRPILESFVVLGVIGTLYVFFNTSGQANQLFPVLAVFGVGIYRILPLAAGASTQVMTVSSSLPSAEMVATLLWEKKEPEAGSAAPLLTKQIEFKNVSFSYKDRKSVLENLSLNFLKNKLYGIVGVSGSGKSTIIDLIAGLYNPQEGQVRIDGVDIRKIDIKTWLNQIGVISQDTFIFSGTIEDNICFGIDTENRDSNRMIEAAKIAYAKEFIELLPEGYQTLVGERGVKLSGGQKQRLAIARAIYLDPPVLIFDEATSSLDANSERKVQEAIKSLYGKRTIIVVAHRLATISEADFIYVIEKGRLTEEGTHQDLKSGGGLYSHLCSKQSLD